MKNNKVLVNTKSKSYPIFIGDRNISSTGSLIKKKLPKVKKICVIVDKNVPQEIFIKLKNSLKKYDVIIHKLSVNERIKNFKLAYKLKKNKLFCITDSVTENNKSVYKHKKNKNYYTNNGILSGSSISMAKSFKNLIQKAGLTVSQSVEMCCITPQKVLTTTSLIFKIEAGYQAKFNIIDEKFNLIESYF